MWSHLEDIIPLMIPFAALMIPIVAILTTHQRKMAEMVRQDRQALGDPQIDALRREVADLKALVHQQAISVDNLVAHQTRYPTPDIRERIGG